MARERGPAGLVALVAGGVAAIIAVGTAGYLALGYGPGDALYMTVTTLTTVGFTPPRPLTGAGKWFTGALAVLGVSAFLVILAVAAGAIAEGTLVVVSRRRRMDRRIEALRDHFILCAYGRVGRAVARELEAEGEAFVVIDPKEELEDDMREDGVLYLIEDPTDEEVLVKAGVERARQLICAVDSDAQNVFITLTARSLNPDIFIVARAAEATSIDQLRRAGADRVVSPYVTSGRQMALLALRPRVVNYLELPGAAERANRLEEISVEEGSPLVGESLGAACGAAAPLLVRRADGRLVSNPPEDLTIEAGDLVILFGDPTALRPVEGP